MKKLMVYVEKLQLNNCSVMVGLMFAKGKEKRME